MHAIPGQSPRPSWLSTAKRKHTRDRHQRTIVAAVTKHKWPVTTAVISAQNLDFPGNKFTHSFTVFAFHCLGDLDTTAKQVYRTLKTGRTAAVSISIPMPHVDALHHAHWRTRGRDGPMPTVLPLEAFQEADLRRALEICTSCYIRVFKHLMHRSSYKLHEHDANLEQ
ncbi:hypothetical protein VMCG_09092 [Cytospora schulzeri]|uniref:Methyltransferase type 11 domain-containing protein n=1 Tax=Cytospora schulzeri TaxID=448051 RepID=A0A423VP45_9PEZI|nr:hypothetical protein VMCG_09092 [Valsa malicola]